MEQSLLESPDTVVPTPRERELAKTAARQLPAKVAEETGLRVRIDDGPELLLPHAALELLSHILTQMGQGNAVTIIPIHAELTTQEAADLLNVSRPYLIGLLDRNAISHHMVGTHRRIRFTDLQAFKRKFEAEREAVMQELVSDAQGQGLGY
jgi:excisionase family DNA binding protein